MIGSENNFQECRTPTSRVESVILQFSTDGGMYPFCIYEVTFDFVQSMIYQ